MNVPTVPSIETGPEVRYGLDGKPKSVGRHWNKHNRRKSKRDPRRIKKTLTARSA